MSNFRVNAKNIFLTYPQCPLTPEKTMELLQLKTWFAEVEQWMCCSEEHTETEGKHLYVLLCFSSKQDIRGSTFFDLSASPADSLPEEVYHPNVQSAKKLNAVKAYVAKGGKFLHNQRFDFSRPNNYIQRKRDFDTWIEEVGDAKPFVPPNLALSPRCDWRFQFDPSIKKRSLWVVGAPNCGKTYTFSLLLRNYDVYWVPVGTPYPFEGYTGQNVIIYDDHYPKFNELADILNVYFHKKHVYGAVRYVTKFWPEEQARIVIVLSNHEPSYGPHDAAVRARFEVCDFDQLLDN